MDLKYAELKRIFGELNSSFPAEDLTAHIVFTEDSWPVYYPQLSRTYRFSSGNKMFWPRMISKSNFGYCLDGTDQGVRLDCYMADESVAHGWKVQTCYILEHMRDVAAIPNLTRTPQEDGTIGYFFGDTCIRAFESNEDGKVTLKPVSGSQAACREWAELEIDRVYGYCTMLERHLNRNA